MDSFLLCDEVWVSSPPPSTPPLHINNNNNNNNNLETYFSSSFLTSNEEFEKAFATCLEKELTYMPQQGYFHHLHSNNNNLFVARFRAIQWLIKSRSRLNLSFTTLFNALNSFDRFLSININQFDGWRMVELVSVACLSVASKLSETCIPSFYEIQMDDLDHWFESITIQRMEVMLSKVLGWRLCSITAYSFVELLTMNIHLQYDLVDRVNQLLLEATLDYKLMEYEPSIVAVSAVWCCLQDLLPSKSDTQIEYIKGFFNEYQKDEIMKCHRIMEGKVGKGKKMMKKCPSSPVTVLLKDEERIHVYDTQIDLSLFELPSNTSFHSANKRRKTESSN